MVFVFLLEKVKPYKDGLFNELEFWEYATSIITIFDGVFFIIEDPPLLLTIAILLVIFLANFFFFSLWIHLFFQNSRMKTFWLLSEVLGRASLAKNIWKDEFKKTEQWKMTLQFTEVPGSPEWKRRGTTLAVMKGESSFQMKSTVDLKHPSKLDSFSDKADDEPPPEPSN